MAPPPDEEFERTIFNPGVSAQPDAGPDAVGHYLVAIGGAEPGRRVEVGGAPITIGRDARQTLAFTDDSQVSRVHARVSLVGGGLVAEDLGSTNGTFLGGERITAPVTLREGNVLRIGRQLLKYERRDRGEVERTEQLDRELAKASRYVLSLLPPPLTDGAVRTDWRFQPSARLGGDAFGYYWLDPGTFVFYLIDVSGHGAGSAMHSVTVLNLLRQRALPDVQFTNPAQVLSSLNARFEMRQHGGMFFTMWYGVYRTATRSLAFSSAGHHPAYLATPDRRIPQPLGAPSLMVGALPDCEYENQETVVAPGSVLYVFSDGVYEITTTDRQRWELSDFVRCIADPPVAGTPESERLYRSVTSAAGSEQLEDDFSLLVVTFP